jgi:hypothetical protein
MKNILYYIAQNTRISEIVTIHCSKVLELTMILSERFLILGIYSKQNKLLIEANNICNAQFTGIRRLGSLGVPLMMGKTWFFPLVVVLPLTLDVGFL